MNDLIDDHQSDKTSNLYPINLYFYLENNKVSKIDFNQIDIPLKLLSEWNCNETTLRVIAQLAYRAGAKFAEEQLAGSWPEPITDRKPTKEDADDQQLVQVMNHCGVWSWNRWEPAADTNAAWRHTPRWKANKSLKEQALTELARLERNFQVSPILRRALEAQP